jgi:murein L,D-transpeptidase YafK
MVRTRPRVWLALAAIGASLAGGPGLARTPDVDRILIEKAARRMTLFSAQGEPLRTYRNIQLGWAPVGAKRFASDGRTPEGHYRIDQGLADSAYHLALHLSYPEARDRAFAAAHGRDAGGAIFIHGQPNGMSNRPSGDWTAGCIAVSDQEIEEIWSMVGDDTDVDILP